MSPRMSKAGERAGMQLGFDMAPILPGKKREGAARMPQSDAPAPNSASTPPFQEFGPDDSGSDLRNPVALSVAQLTRRITTLLEDGIGMVWVEGEISNLRRQSSGHSYFTLKDEHAQLSCVLFSRSAQFQNVEMQDGLQVCLHGQISVYQARGQYQLIVSLIQVRGEGVLRARFEELKRRLAAEGVFDQVRKRPLPRFPRRIGLVTSPTGAAIRDFLNVLHRRHPGLRVLISPVRVQGRGAAAEIAAAIGELSSGSQTLGQLDVIVLTRGGGSLEDLWEFNEEAVARAIAASAVPVVSAVGHEIDFTIADFAADLRAPTPSAAAELLAADSVEVDDRLRSLVARIGREVSAMVERQRAREARLAASLLFRDPLRHLDDSRQTADRFEETLSGLMDRRREQIDARLDTLGARLRSCHPGVLLERTNVRLASAGDLLALRLGGRIDREKGRISRLEAALFGLSPSGTLARGFSITRNAMGEVITSASQVRPGETIRTQLAGGILESGIVKSVPAGESRD